MTAIRLRLIGELRARSRAWVALALLIGVAGGAVLLTASGARRTNSAYARYLRASRASDLLIAPLLNSYDDALARVPGVETIARASLLNPVDKRDRPAPFAVLAAGTGYADAVDRPKIVSGRMYRAGSADEAVADTRLAAQLHLHPGGALAFTVTPQNGPRNQPPRRVELRVVGVVATRNDAVAVSTNDAVPQLLVTPALSRRLGPNYRLDYVVVRLRPGASPAAVAREAHLLAQRYPAIAKEIDIGNEADEAAKIERAIRPQAAALAIFALLAALAALVVVGQVATRELFVSSVDVPTLRAMGATRVQLLAIMLLEIAAVAIVGAAIAVFLAIVTSPLVLFGAARVSEPRPGIAADWTVLGIGAVGIVVLLLARTAWSAWRLSGATTDLQRASTGTDVVRPSLVARTVARSPAPVSTVTGVRLALEPGRGRTAVPVRSALVGSVIALGAVAAAFTFGSNLVHLVSTPRLYGQTWDVAVDAQFGSPPTRAFVQMIGNHPGLDRLSFGDYATLQVGGRAIPGVGIIPGRGAPLFPAMVQGRAPRRDNEVALGSATLAQLHAHVGDAIDASIAGNAVKLRIVGRAVFPSLGQGSFPPTGLGDGAALWGPQVARLGPPPDAGGAPPGTANFALVHIAAGQQHNSNVRGVVAGINHSGKCIVGECALLTAQRPADIRNYSAVEAAPLALAALLGLLAIASVANVLLTSIRRRRRELAVLTALGFTRRQISAAVAWQAVTLAVVTLAVGLPLGVAAGRGIWIVFSTHLDVVRSVHVPVAPTLLMIPGALVIAILLAVAPAWATHRLHPAAVLRTE